MYILKNALTSIIRNKGRNILIGIIILVIASATSVTLAINNSSKSLIESYKNKYETIATLEVNRQNMMGNFNREDMASSREQMQEMFSTASKITVEDIEKYGTSKLVSDYYYTMSVGVNSTNLEKAESTSNNGFPGGRGDKGFGGQNQGDFTLTGYSKIEAMENFISGTYKISEGAVSTDFDSNNCIINKELATLNDINVGDIITVTDVLDETKTYELTVSGIFEENNEENNMSMFSNSVNNIITNTNFIQKIKDNNSELNIQTSPSFTLISSEVVEEFEKELQEKGLNENLSVRTNLDQVENSTKTISNVKSFSLSFLIITLIIGTVVLLVINMINIRERKYEIGVLRTIGMKKSKVALQFLLELLIVAFVSLLLGAGIGSIISVPVSNSLLQSEIESSKQEMTNIRENFGQRPDQNNDSNREQKQFNRFNGVTNVQAFDSINAVVDFKVLIELLIIGLVITLISCTSAIISIERFSPPTILKERS